LTRTGVSASRQTLDRCRFHLSLS